MSICLMMSFLQFSSVVGIIMCCLLVPVCKASACKIVRILPPPGYNAVFRCDSCGDNIRWLKNNISVASTSTEVISGKKVSFLNSQNPAEEGTWQCQNALTNITSQPVPHYVQPQVTEPNRTISIASPANPINITFSIVVGPQTRTHPSFMITVSQILDCGNTVLGISKGGVLDGIYRVFYEEDNSLVIELDLSGKQFPVVLECLVQVIEIQFSVASVVTIQLTAPTPTTVTTPPSPTTPTVTTPCLFDDRDPQIYEFHLKFAVNVSCLELHPIILQTLRDTVCISSPELSCMSPRDAMLSVSSPSTVSNDTINTILTPVSGPLGVAAAAAATPTPTTPTALHYSIIVCFVLSLGILIFVVVVVVMVVQYIKNRNRGRVRPLPSYDPLCGHLTSHLPVPKLSPPQSIHSFYHPNNPFHLIADPSLHSSDHAHDLLSLTDISRGIRTIPNHWTGPDYTAHGQRHFNNNR